MSADLPGELDAFRQFIAEQVHRGHSDLSPEQCLQSWRAEHPSVEELNESTAVLTQAIKEMKTGDRGTPVRDAIDELRRKHGLTRS